MTVSQDIHALRKTLDAGICDHPNLELHMNREDSIQLSSLLLIIEDNAAILEKQLAEAREAIPKPADVIDTANVVCLQSHRNKSSGKAGGRKGG